MVRRDRNHPSIIIWSAGNEEWSLQSSEASGPPGGHCAWRGPTPTPPAQPPASSPSAQVVPPAIDAALHKVIAHRDVALDSPDTALKILTRRLKDANLYFFFNEGPQPP